MDFSSQQTKRVIILHPFPYFYEFVWPKVSLFLQLLNRQYVYYTFIVEILCVNNKKISLAKKNIKNRTVQEGNEPLQLVGLEPGEDVLCVK